MNKIDRFDRYVDKHSMKVYVESLKQKEAASNQKNNKANRLRTLIDMTGLQMNINSNIDTEQLDNQQQ